ncbi:hypothetical protein CTZ27_12040 [Streptomyces griseocarneus]|nr:hypothetical protein CTZ27_12040 [Streptomyces griseocarneus]
MWNTRFQRFAIDLIKNGNNPQVAGVSEWLDKRSENELSGFVVEFTTGATAHFHTPMMLAPGAKHEGSEEIVEGEPVAPVAFPDSLGAGGKIKLADVEQWFIALLASSGNREISDLEAWSQREDARPRHAGVTVSFHSGGKVFAAVAYLLRPGMSTDEQTYYEPLEVA